MSESSNPPSTPNAEPPGWPAWYRLWILPYLGISALWPVLLVVLGHFWVVLCVLILHVVRVADVLSWMALVIVLLASVGTVSFELQHNRRIGSLSLTVLATWIISGFLAWLVDTHGLY